MKHITFKNVDEVVKYLTDNHFDETKFFVIPDYIKSIFGITDNGILLYSYTDMVEELYLEYTENDKIKDPYTSAIEFIGFNVTDVGKGSPIVVYETPIEGYNHLFECEGLDEFLDKYESVIIGMDSHDNLLIDDDLCDEDKNAINTFIENYKEIDVLYV